MWPFENLYGIVTYLTLCCFAGTLAPPKNLLLRMCPNYAYRMAPQTSLGLNDLFHVYCFWKHG